MDNNHLPVSDLPAPWLFEGEAWWFFTALFHRPKKGEMSAPGYFDPLHEHSRSLATEEDAYLGNHGMIQLLRYTESPAGPYDELILIPGSFKSPPGLKPAEAPRITRIYVSAMNSVINGRRNWNIPKTLAKFSFAPNSDGEMEVKVFAPTSFENPESSIFSDTPFFAVNIRPRAIPLPEIPLNLKHSPIPFTLVQPPLEASPTAAQDGCIGTDNWVSVDVADYRGRVKPISWKGDLTVVDPDTQKVRTRIADGVGFPDIVPYSIGLHFAQLKVQVPEGIIHKMSEESE
ncbi:hypothetical protein SCP_0500400 [Sparassis crispa]|uniref:Acetoacetate decarboxylase n=1 Tax=Sparassis crispa TaxID=139825 RepID=A0A401GLE2_9APHY|nr:hypothetical protein SCP_0500400 [Sparassis crispa]GBE82997.1 hypothetical protein SCP_0500400 [Sparassis crispa]